MDSVVGLPAFSLLLIRLAILASGANAAIALAQTPRQPPDPSWIRDFASPSNETQAGRENALNGDPRFHSLLESSFHQRQSFWRDHGRFTPLAELVHTFLGVPGSVLLDSDRYITVDGCVPHDCGDRGMIWIDTAAHPATLIFVATGLVSNGPKDTGTICHLWLFSSQPINWQKLPEPFLSSRARWSSANRAKGYEENIVLVTLVKPDGAMIDLSPSLLSFSR
jgi:hypothetical protein